MPLRDSAHFEELKGHSEQKKHKNDRLCEFQDCDATPIWFQYHFGSTCRLQPLSGSVGDLFHSFRCQFLFWRWIAKDWLKRYLLVADAVWMRLQSLGNT